ncbi:MAG: hypothetical protein WD669_07375 [Pirellulales bacterium]
MPANRRKARRQKSPPARSDPPEGRAAELFTIAWTVSVTGVLIADLMCVGAHLLVRANPGAATLNVLEAVLLLSAAAMGAVSLVLLAAAWRKRRVKPPHGFTVFALLVSLAPIVAALARLLR